jgi:hypothetical protein
MLILQTRADLQRLIDEKLPESLALDYKASPALNKGNDGRNELVKDVTAFANSAGGQIIYGIVEKGGIPSQIDGGVDRTQITAESILQIIDTNASPRVHGLRVFPIVLNDESPTLVAYVLDIPAATSFAPHQNGLDKKYYRRFELRSVPMHDYEIRDLMGRSNRPELVCRLLFHDRSLTLDLRNKHDQFDLYVEYENLGGEPALYSLWEIYIDQRIQLVSSSGYRHMSPILNFSNWNFTRVQQDFMVPSSFPLCKGSHIDGPRLTCELSDLEITSDRPLLIGYSVVTPGFHTARYAPLFFKDNSMLVGDFISLESADRTDGGVVD